jgi:hypothetical protein
MIWNKRAWIAVTLLLLGIAVIASLAFWYRQGTPPPSAQGPDNCTNPNGCELCRPSGSGTRTTNDEAIKNAYRLAKESVANLSADTVVLELNLLLDELRQRNP